MGGSANATVPGKITCFAAHPVPTKDEYVRHVRKLGEHYACDPATLIKDSRRCAWHGRSQ